MTCQGETTWQEQVQVAPTTLPRKEVESNVSLLTAELLVRLPRRTRKEPRVRHTQTHTHTAVRRLTARETREKYLHNLALYVEWHKDIWRRTQVSTKLVKFIHIKDEGKRILYYKGKYIFRLHSLIFFLSRRPWYSLIHGKPSNGRLAAYSQELLFIVFRQIFIILETFPNKRLFNSMSG